MPDENEADDKIIAVLNRDAVFGSMQDISDCPEGLVQRLTHYFVSYKQMPGAKTEREVTHVYGRQEAHHVILESKADYDGRFSDLASLPDEDGPTFMKLRRNKASTCYRTREYRGDETAGPSITRCRKTFQERVAEPQISPLRPPSPVALISIMRFS
jgi:hypothetical protein